jgi:hypothetical protein
VAFEVEDFRAAPVKLPSWTIRQNCELPPALAGMFTYLYTVVVKNNWAAGTSPDIEEVLGRGPIGFEAFAEDHRVAWAIQ